MGSMRWAMSAISPRSGQHRPATPSRPGPLRPSPRHPHRSSAPWAPRSARALRHQRVLPPLRPQELLTAVRKQTKQALAPPLMQPERTAVAERALARERAAQVAWQARRQRTGTASCRARSRYSDRPRCAGATPATPARPVATRAAASAPLRARPVIRRNVPAGRARPPRSCAAALNATTV